MFDKFTLTLCFFLFIFIQPSKTQTVENKQQTPPTTEIRGNLFELEEKTEATGDTIRKEVPVIGANISLLNSKDSTIVTGATSDAKGNFILPSVKQGNYLLSVTFLGYNPVSRTISSEMFKEKSITMGKIQMGMASLELSEVTVTAIPPEMVVKTDTIEYNADAYRMDQNAVAEDLLKRLDGVEVDVNGNIKAAGKDVKKVLVDGKEFFGKDLKMATKNITTDIIDKIQVIDKKTDQAERTGIDDGEKETIINIAIKKGMNQGWMGNANVGGGALTDNPNNESARYASNAMISRFREGDNLSLVLNANNINDGGGRGGGGGGNGITDAVSAGINLYKMQDKKYKASGSVSYRYADALSKSKRFRQNILVDSVSYSRNLSENRNFSNNVNFNTTLEFTPDTFNTFTFEVGISYNKAASRSESLQSTLAGDADSTKVNQSERKGSNSSDSWNTNFSLTYAHKFDKRGRRFSVVGDFGLNRSDGNGTNQSLSQFFLQPDRNKQFNQESETNTQQNNYGIRLTFAEPVWGYRNTLQFSYSINNNQTTNIKETYDYDPETGTYTLLNPDYSKSLDNNYVNQRVGVSFNSNQEKFYYNIGLNVIPSYTQSTSFIKDGNVNGNDSILNKIKGRKVINFSPQGRFRYNFAPRNTLSFNYSGSTRQPSVTQLDPTVDNTNPLRIRSGNPDLLPSFSNNMSLEYSNYHREKQRSLNINANFSFTMNEIINFTDYEEITGIQYTKPINENGSWNSSFNVMYNMPFGFKNRFRLSTNSAFNYRNQIGFVMVKKQSERNVSGTTNLRENLSLSYINDIFYGQLRGNISYSNTQNTLEGRSSTVNTNFGVAYNTTISLPKDWKFSTDINYRANRGLSTGYNLDEVLWNLDINKLFMVKRRQLSVSLRWVDILQQNKSISRDVTASYIEDNEYNSLTGYVLVTFSLRLREMGGRKGRGSGSENREFRNFQPSGGGNFPGGGGNRGGSGGGGRR